MQTVEAGTYSKRTDTQLCYFAKRSQSREYQKIRQDIMLLNKVCLLSWSAETWTLRAVDQKQLESFEMWCWRRMEKISWTDHVTNKEVLRTVKEQRNILHEISKRKANWIGHILRRNFFLQQVIEGKIKEG
jgi:hypothetical protein